MSVSLAMSDLKPDINESIRFLSAIHPDRLRIITTIDAKRRLETKAFGPKETEKMAAFIAAYQNQRNYYYAFNVLSPSAIGTTKASKADIEAAIGFHVDIDAKEDAPLQQELDRILGVLKAYPIRPSLTVYSGGGYQALWLLKEPFVLGDDARIAEIEGRNFALAKDLCGDKAHNIDRILRLPGTINVPDAGKLKKGRVPAVARIVSWN
jgi:hypothetical protein